MDLFRGFLVVFILFVSYENHLVESLQQPLGVKQIDASSAYQFISQQAEPAGEPSPEPYSFSYSSESNGGLSTHQESGDGTGRVSGFYTIMGDDGRERRVDYVADAMGYRAKIRTNEIGTRGQSSADAEYEVQPPSEGQLQAAKVTFEQYKYLEEQHAYERERQLSKFRAGNSQQAQFQQFQQQQQSKLTPQNQQVFSAITSAAQRGAQFQQQQQPNVQQQQSTLFSGIQPTTGYNRNNTSFTNQQLSRGSILNNNNNEADLLSSPWANSQQQQRQQQQQPQRFQQTLVSGNQSLGVPTSLTALDRFTGVGGITSNLSQSTLDQTTSIVGQTGGNLVQVQPQSQQPQAIPQSQQGPVNTSYGYSNLNSQQQKFSRPQEKQQQSLAIGNNNNNQQPQQPQQQQFSQTNQQTWQQQQQDTNSGAGLGFTTRRPTAWLQKQLEQQVLLQASADRDYPRQPAPSLINGGLVDQQQQVPKGEKVVVGTTVVKPTQPIYVSAQGISYQQQSEEEIRTPVRPGGGAGASPNYTLVNQQTAQQQLQQQPQQPQQAQPQRPLSQGSFFEGGAQITQEQNNIINETGQYEDKPTNEVTIPTIQDSDNSVTSQAAQQQQLQQQQQQQQQQQSQIPQQQQQQPQQQQQQQMGVYFETTTSAGLGNFLPTVTESTTTSSPASNLPTGLMAINLNDQDDRNQQGGGILSTEIPTSPQQQQVFNNNNINVNQQEYLNQQQQEKEEGPFNNQQQLVQVSQPVQQQDSYQQINNNNQQQLDYQKNVIQQVTTVRPIYQQQQFVQEQQQQQQQRPLNDEVQLQPVRPNSVNQIIENIAKQQQQQQATRQPQRDTTMLNVTGTFNLQQQQPQQQQQIQQQKFNQTPQFVNTLIVRTTTQPSRFVEPIYTTTTTPATITTSTPISYYNITSPVVPFARQPQQQEELATTPASVYQQPSTVTPLGSFTVRPENVSFQLQQNTNSFKQQNNIQQSTINTSGGGVKGGKINQNQKFSIPRYNVTSASRPTLSFNTQESQTERPLISLITTTRVPFYPTRQTYNQLNNFNQPPYTMNQQQQQQQQQPQQQISTSVAISSSSTKPSSKVQYLNDGTGNSRYVQNNQRVVVSQNNQSPNTDREPLYVNKDYSTYSKNVSNIENNSTPTDYTNSTKITTNSANNQQGIYNVPQSQPQSQQKQQLPQQRQPLKGIKGGSSGAKRQQQFWQKQQSLISGSATIDPYQAQAQQVKKVYVQSQEQDKLVKAPQQNRYSAPATTSSSSTISGDSYAIERGFGSRIGLSNQN